MAWSVAQRLRLAYRHPKPAEGKTIAEQLIASLPSCPIPEVARPGRTLKQWSASFLAYFDTDRASNGGTEAINGLVELHRRIARGSATATTTAYGCSSSAADCQTRDCDPTGSTKSHLRRVPLESVHVTGASQILSAQEGIFVLRHVHTAPVDQG